MYRVIKHALSGDITNLRITRRAAERADRRTAGAVLLLNMYEVMFAISLDFRWTLADRVTFDSDNFRLYCFVQVLFWKVEK